MLKRKLKPSKVIIYLLLIIITIITLFPIVLMVTNSFMDRNQVVAAYSQAINKHETAKYASFKFIPDSFTFMQYYYALLRKPTFLVMLWNSIKLTVPITIGQVVISTLGAYGFAKIKFPYRDQLFFLLIVLMLMPYQVTLVPNYIVLRKINLLGSNLSVILPGIFSAFGVFLLKQFIMTIPDEQIEAAKIDGAGHLKIFINMILPQCKGGIASLAILIFIDSWNMVEQPLIFLKNQNMYPLSIYLSSINIQEIGIAFACGIIFMIPTILIFLHGEESLLRGIEISNKAKENV